MVHIGNSWDDLLKDEFDKDYYLKLRQFLIGEYKNHTVYPDMHDIFNALVNTPYEDVKVVILGQDPYHEPGQAHGMCFSVKPGVKTPPSLVNIYKELKDDLGIEPHSGGYLMKWAKQGVLLMNTCLTVREHQAGSHRNKGWEILTDKIIELLNQREKPPDSHRRSSESSVGVQRIFRRKILLAGQRVSRFHGSGACGLGP